MTDYAITYDMPYACIACGKEDSDNLVQHRFNLFGGQSSEKIGPKRYLTHHHYAQGVAYICPSCHEQAKKKEVEYIPKLKNFTNMFIVIGLILLPVSFVLYQARATLGSIMAISLLLMTIFCTLGMSGSEADDQFKRAKWVAFYANYSYSKGITKTTESFKFASKDFAEKFQVENPGIKVKVGTTHRFIPIKKPDDWVTCCIGLIPLIIFFFIVGVMTG
jgi:hypothetical protein